MSRLARAAKFDAVGLPHEWTPVLDRHPDPTVTGPLAGYVYLDTPARVLHVARHRLEFWYDPPGVAMTDAELALLRSIPTDEAMVVKVDGKAITDAKALEQVVETLRGFQQVGWVELVTSPAKGRYKYKAAAAKLTAEGVRVLGMLGA